MVMLGSPPGVKDQRSFPKSSGRPTEVANWPPSHWRPGTPTGWSRIPHQGGKVGGAFICPLPRYILTYCQGDVAGQQPKGNGIRRGKVKTECLSHTHTLRKA